MEPILSLVGFLQEAAAVDYLEKLCIVDDPSPAARLHVWNSARAQLGPPFQRAGQPEILDLPQSALPYLQGVMTNPRFADSIETMQWSFKLVEIDPLLSFQQQVFYNRAATVTATVAGVPTLDQMLPHCLPQTLESIEYQVAFGPNGFAIRSRNSNLRVLRWGPKLHYDDVPQLTLGGVGFGTTSPLIQVVRFNGRCYLKNGYHRAYGLRGAGATHLPCLFLEGASWDKVGAAPGGFDQALLESPNPPTCAHFTQGRAYQLSMRDIYRVINLTWQESWMIER
jgi:hypothetical protein